MVGLIQKNGERAETVHTTKKMNRYEHQVGFLRKELDTRLSQLFLFISSLFFFVKSYCSLCIRAAGSRKKCLRCCSVNELFAYEAKYSTFINKKKRRSFRRTSSNQVAANDDTEREQTNIFSIVYISHPHGKYELLSMNCVENG